MAGSFVFNSDYPIDKVAWMQEGEVDVEYEAFYAEWAFDLPTPLFCQGIWSLDNWQTTWNMNILDPTGQTYEVYSELTSGNHGVVWFAFAPAQYKKAQYRIWGFLSEEDAKDVDMPPTRPLSKQPFIFNSDYKYPQIIYEGMVDDRDGFRVQHNLGYPPMVEVWEAYKSLDEHGEPWWEVYPIGSCHITDTEVWQNADPSASPGNYTYYRIYKNE